MSLLEKWLEQKGDCVASLSLFDELDNTDDIEMMTTEYRKHASQLLHVSEVGKHLGPYDSKADGLI